MGKHRGNIREAMRPNQFPRKGKGMDIRKWKRKGRETLRFPIVSSIT